MRVVFFGSPEFAVCALEAIHRSDHQLVGVVTQPARPKGRGLGTTPSAVGRRARELGLPVEVPGQLDDQLVEAVRAWRPDVLAVVAYGRLLPPSLLAVAPRGAINLHPSLLPRHRGAAPIPHAILAGDTVTGVTIMQLDERLDAGGSLLTVETPIGRDEDAEALATRLADLGSTLLVEVLDRLERGQLAAVPQPQEGATYARKLNAEDGWVDWTEPALSIARKVRGLRPWPAAQTRLPDGRRLKILRARVIEEVGSGAVAGQVTGVGSRGIEVDCGVGRISILEAQVEGKRVMSAADLSNGRMLRAGDRLGV